MRDQLHLMELVDNYLDGTMNTSDRAAFEERLRTNEELRSLVEDQKHLRRAARRSPVRAEAKRAFRKYRWGKMWPGIGGGLVVILALSTAAFFIWAKSEREAGPFVEQLENGSSSDAQPAELSDTVGTGLRPLVMLVDPRKDTTILTPNGVLLDVPEGLFVDSAGAKVNSTVRITMLEAFDAATIMKAGLSTMSGDTLLETGGMFYVDARSEGKTVAIAKGRAINVLVPADGVAPGMKLYDGVMRKDSVIDWQDPVELPRTLVPVDITTLDFYPPGYAAKLRELGYSTEERAFLDSLYFSFKCSSPLRKEHNAVGDSLRADLDEPLDFFGHGAMFQNGFKAEQHSNSGRQPGKIASGCGIVPTNVKAIWNPRFNGTNLATREFEERMIAIHKSCDNAILDLYVNNLDDDLRTLDRRAAQLGHAEFVAFAKRNEGRVILPEGSAERLKKLYAEWSLSFARAIRDAQANYWSKQGELDARIQQLSNIDQKTETTVRQQLLREETDMNLRSAYDQLGYTVPSNSGSVAGSSPTRQGNTQVNVPQRNAALPPPPRIAFNAQVRTLGWKNIDQAMSAAYSRQSVRISDGRNGKQAMIKYDPCIVTVTDQRSYDNVRVYLLPQGTSGYQRMNPGLGDRFEEKLNALLVYDLVVLAQKNGSSFFFEQRDLKGTAQLTASLQPISESDLLGRLNRFDRVRGTGLLNASNYMAKAVADAPRQRQNRSRIELRDSMLPIVFPCATLEEKSAPDGSATRVDWEASVNPLNGSLMEFDTPPTFPGGDRAMRQFIYDRLKMPDAAQRKGISGNVIVSFRVTENGTVQEVRSVSGPDDGCWAEAERTVRLMPKWSPALKNGNPVPVRMTVPVMFLPRMDRLN